MSSKNEFGDEINKERFEGKESIEDSTDDLMNLFAELKDN